MRVRCSPGAAFEASVVVGADGVHSLTREWVTGGDDPVYSGTSGFRGLVPAERLSRLPDPGALQFWMGPGAHLLHYPVDGGRYQLPGRGRRTGPVDGARLDGAGAPHPARTWRPSRAGTRRSPR